MWPNAADAGTVEVWLTLIAVSSMPYASSSRVGVRSWRRARSRLVGSSEWVSASASAAAPSLGISPRTLSCLAAAAIGGRPGRNFTPTRRSRWNWAVMGRLGASALGSSSWTFLGQTALKQIVATNLFHRAVVFGSFGSTSPAGSLSRLLVNGEVRASARVPDAESGRVVSDVSRLLEAAGEQLRPGDKLICGSIVQVPVVAGDHVVADLGSLGYAEAHIAHEPAGGR